MKYLLTIAFSAASLLAANAQTGPWTLRECMIYAVEHSPETNIQAAQNNIAKQNYREAIGLLLPSLGASSSAEFNFGRGLDPDTNTYTDRASFGNSYSLSSSLTIFGGFQRVNNIRMEKINRITGRHELDRKRDEVAHATMEAFFNVLYRQKMVVLAQSQLEESRLNLRQTERMEELGLKGFPDVAEMRAQEAANSYLLTEQQNLLAIGVILLKEQMFFPIEQELAIVSDEPGGYVSKSGESAQELYARALDYLPKALAAASAARASEMALKIARGQRYPSISLNAGYNTGFSRSLESGDPFEAFADQIRNKRGYYVGARLSIPILNGFSASTSVRRSKYNLDIARIQRDDALRALYTEIEQAVADMNGTADMYARAVRQRESASVAHDVNQRKYDEGLVSALELHTSSNRLVEARATELNSRLTWILKKRMVDYYAGTPLISPEPELR